MRSHACKLYHDSHIRMCADSRFKSACLLNSEVKPWHAVFAPLSVIVPEPEIPSDRRVETLSACNSSVVISKAWAPVWKVVRKCICKVICNYASNRHRDQLSKIIALCRSAIPPFQHLSIRCRSITADHSRIIDGSDETSSFCCCIGPMSSLKEASAEFYQLSQQVKMNKDVHVTPVLARCDEQLDLDPEGESMIYPYIVMYRLRQSEYLDQWKPLDPILANAIQRIVWLADFVSSNMALIDHVGSFPSTETSSPFRTQACVTCMC